jgi:hypothetical protein
MLIRYAGMAVVLPAAAASMLQGRLEVTAPLAEGEYAKGETLSVSGQRQARRAREVATAAAQRMSAQGRRQSILYRVFTATVFDDYLNRKQFPNTDPSRSVERCVRRWIDIATRVEFRYGTREHSLD